MYRMTCDGYPLLDTRDDEYILGSPRVKTEVNTVGEGSFKIYFNHPNIDRLVPLRSIFEVRDEYGVLFRGRMTEDTKDIYNGKDVDLEGVMAFFNDSVVRPYVFPDDFEEDAEYIEAAAETAEEAALDGGVVRFYLKWLIERHNEQVEPFQRFKLGRVTVYDKNNYLERESSVYPNTWNELSDKTFNSSLGGYLCIRYEEDGNYIDYLREFTEVNEQGITYGENMLDINQNTDASGTYSAIIPLGADIEAQESDGDVYEGLYGDIVDSSTVKKKLTIKDLPDGDITDDIVKEGDTLYSKSAVAAYGWRYAPRDETTWDDVKEAQNLQTKGVDFLVGDSTKIPTTIKVTAVDQNCTDAQIRSFRIYKKIPVYTPAHGVNDNFDLTSLDSDLLNPQNTKITVGKTHTTFTDFQSKQQSTFSKQLQSSLKNVLNSVEKGFVQNTTLKETLNNYAPTSQLEGLIKADDIQKYNFITMDDVEKKGYAPSSALSGLLKADDIKNYNFITMSDVEQKGYVLPSALNDYAKTSALSDYAKTSALGDLVKNSALEKTLEDYAKKDTVLSEIQIQALIEEALKKKEPEIPDGLRFIAPPTMDGWDRLIYVLDNLGVENNLVKKIHDDSINKDYLEIDCEYLARSTNKHIDARSLFGYVIYTDIDKDKGEGSTVIKYDASKEDAAPFYRISLEFCAVDGRDYPVFDATYFYTDYSTLKEKEVSDIVYIDPSTTNCSIDIDVVHLGNGVGGAEFKIKFDLDRPVYVYKMRIYLQY